LSLGIDISPKWGERGEYKFQPSLRDSPGGAANCEGAMTAIGVTRAPEKPFEMIVDRPFFFVIEDDKTQSILFMGVVYDPAGQGGGG
jgi:hypothetical protein